MTHNATFNYLYDTNTIIFYVNGQNATKDVYFEAIDNLYKTGAPLMIGNCRVTLDQSKKYVNKLVSFQRGPRSKIMKADKRKKYSLNLTEQFTKK